MGSQRCLVQEFFTAWHYIMIISNMGFFSVICYVCVIISKSYHAIAHSIMWTWNPLIIDSNHIMFSKWQITLRPIGLPSPLHTGHYTTGHRNANYFRVFEAFINWSAGTSNFLERTLRPLESCSLFTSTLVAPSTHECETSKCGARTEFFVFLFSLL